jgi:hypothetical protein
MMTDEQAAGEVEASGSVTASRVYVCPARDQLFLLAVCMRDWLEEGHLAWFVLDVVAEMDTSALHSRTAEDAAVAADAQRAAVAAGAAAKHGRKLAGRKPTEPHAALARAQIDHAVAVKRVDAMQAARERTLAAADRGEKITGRECRRNRVRLVERTHHAYDNTQQDRSRR